jgi:SAM-dependent methyltransferase
VTSIFLCPECRNPLPNRPPCVCGFVLRESDGIIDLLSGKQAAAAAPFIEAYERVRAAEQWGDDDLDLPFHAKRHREIWSIRASTFRHVEQIVTRRERGVALDIGAGNCWMSRYLDRWGFDTIALDINTGKADGLRAGQKFIDEGAKFLRVRAGMESLPFISESITLLIANASFHYATDFRATLSEFERVLTPGGAIVIVDTPVYDDASDGERMIAERVEDFRRKYDIPAELGRRARYLTRNDLEAIPHLNVQPVWLGLGRAYETARARLFGHRIAKFPVLVIEK